MSRYWSSDWDETYDEYDDEDDRDTEFFEDRLVDRLIDGVGFASPGSALRAATDDNPRNQPCPTCGGENRLTPIDVQRGYQCDSCADLAEGGKPGSFADY